MNTIKFEQLEAMKDNELVELQKKIDFEQRYRTIPQQPEELEDVIVTLWCDNCYAWVQEVTVDILPNGEKWVCCQACCNGLIHYEKVKV